MSARVLCCCVVASLVSCIGGTYAEEPSEIDITVIGYRWADLFENPNLESPGLGLSETVIDTPAMERQNAHTVSAAQRYVPGAWTERRGRKVKEFVSIRGQKYPYPEYSIDGAWQREFHESTYFFNSANIDRIEIMRSSSAMMIGPGGMAGRVNLVPKVYEKRETTVRAEYGTYNTADFHVNHGNRIDSLSYAVGVGSSYTDGPTDRNGQERMSDAFVGVTHQTTEKLTLSMNAFGLYGRRELMQALPPASSKFQLELGRFDPFTAFMAVGKAKYRASARSATDLTWGYALRDHEYIAGSEGLATTHVTTDEEDHEYTINLAHAMKLSDNNVLRVGGLYNHWIAPNGKRFYAGKRSDLETYSAVIVDEHRINKVHMNAGYRWSRTYMNNYGGFSINGSSSGLRSVTPIVGEWDKPTHNLNAGIGYYFEQNSSVHLNLLGGQVEPRSGALDTNGNEPGRETRIKADLGWTTKKDGIGDVSVVAFYVNQDEAIALSGSTLDVNGQTLELYLNRDQEQYGLELDLKSAEMGDGWHCFGNAVAMESRAYNSTSTSMTRNKEMPEIILGGGVSLARGKVDCSVHAKYVSDYESSRFAPSSVGPQPLGDYLVVSANAGYSFGAEAKHRAYLSVDNLTDNEYSTVVGYPESGMRFALGMRSTF
jgi:hypothetical protein